jgi:hypothetical protein
VQPYALRFRAATGEAVVTTLEDLVGIVGADPARCTENFLTSYPARPWAGMEQHRLPHGIDRALPVEA